MEWLDRMNAVIDYIESNLANEISYDKAAQIACCSTYHFQRMFAFIANMPLSEYVRRRRLTAAAFELQSGDAKIIDVAAKYGYESPEAFSRAFKKMHGMKPVSVRRKGKTLKAYPKMTFFLSIKGDVEMNYQIEEKPAFTIFGVSRKINRKTIILNDPKDEVANFWGEMLGSGEDDKICQLAQNNILGLMWHGENGAAFSGYNEKVMPYLIGSFKKDGIDTSGDTEVNIPAATWAIFRTEKTFWGSGLVSNHLRETFDRIWGEWFPVSGYEHAQLPELEIFIWDDDGEFAEVWMPIVKAGKRVCRKRRCWQSFMP